MAVVKNKKFAKLDLRQKLDNSVWGGRWEAILVGLFLCFCYW